MESIPPQKVYKSFCHFLFCTCKWGQREASVAAPLSKVHVCFNMELMLHVQGPEWALEMCDHPWRCVFLSIAPD